MKIVKPFKKVMGIFFALVSYIYIQQVLDYRDLDYRDPCNTGIHKKFHLFDYREILEIPGDLNSRYFKEFPIIKCTEFFIKFTNCISLEF